MGKSCGLDAHMGQLVYIPKTAKISSQVHLGISKEITLAVSHFCSRLDLVLAPSSQICPSRAAFGFGPGGSIFTPIEHRWTSRRYPAMHECDHFLFHSPEGGNGVSIEQLSTQSERIQHYDLTSASVAGVCLTTAIVVTGTVISGNQLPLFHPSTLIFIVQRLDLWINGRKIREPFAGPAGNPLTRISSQYEHRLRAVLSVVHSHFIEPGSGLRSFRSTDHRIIN